MTAAPSTPTGRGRIGIGEVIRRLRPDFPDVSVSKIRFLEAEGLIDPERTASGYRKFSAADMDRLRYILTAQRDRYYPLKVIKEHLDAMERGLEPPEARGEAPRAPQPAPAPTDAREFGPAPLSDLRLSAAELLAGSGLRAEQLEELESFGLLRRRAGTEYFDADALDVATTVAELSGYGLEPRHIRAFKAAADREVGLIEQVVAPLARHKDAEARTRAADMVSELGALSVRLHAALVKIGLRGPR